MWNKLAISLILFLGITVMTLGTFRVFTQGALDAADYGFLLLELLVLGRLLSIQIKSKVDG